MVDYTPDAHPYGKTSGTRYVKTPNGSQYYGLPIGAPITPDVEKAAKLKSIQHLLEPKGSVGATIANAILDKHGPDAVGKLYTPALNAFKLGHPVQESVDIAAAQSGMKQIPVYIHGKPAGYLPPGSVVYVGKSFASKPKGATVAYAKANDSYYSITAGGVSPLGPSVTSTLQKSIDNGIFVKVNGGDDNVPSVNTPNPDAPKVPSPNTTSPNASTLDVNSPDPNATKPIGHPETSTDLKGPDGSPILPPKGIPNNNVDEKANAEAEGDAGEIGANTSPSTAPGSMQPNQSTLQKPAPSAESAKSPSLTNSNHSGEKKFEVLADSGDSGDGYFADALPTKLWGKFGAAGVMLRHTDKETGEEKFLLVQRGPSVSTNKGKWQLPGGALNSNENDYQGTARELTEELQPPDGYLDTMTPKGEVLFNHPTGWHYNNIVADVPEQFDATVDGDETGAAKWMTHDEVMNADLHPALKSNLDAIFGQFGGPAGSKSDTPTDNNSTAELHGDAAAPPEPDAVDVALQDNTPDIPKTAPKPVFVGGTSVGEVPADTKLIVGAGDKGAPNSAKAVYALHSDGTAEVYTADGAKKLSPTAAQLVNTYVKEGSYVDVDEANAANEAALNPNAPKPSTPTVSALDKPDPWDNPEPADPFGPPPAPTPEDKGPKKDVYLKGKKVGQVSQTSTLYTSPNFFNNPKQSSFVYAEHSDGSITVFDDAHEGGYKPDPEGTLFKFINDDIDTGIVSAVDSYEGDGTPEDIFSSKNDFKEPSLAKVDVGGVMVDSTELASAISALKNGDSWQVKVHLKGHPLYNMDYLSVAKAYNKKHGKNYATKDAVINALEEKFHKLPSTDAQDAAVKGPIHFADEPKTPSNKVNVGGIDLTKSELEGAISLVKDGPSAYPKVNLKGHKLHGIDMPKVMFQESKKADQSTKDVLLKHLNKKLSQFHDDEITGQTFAEPDELPPAPVTPVKGLAQLVAEAKAAAPITPVVSTDIDLGDGVKVKPGVYKKPNGYFANITVNPDGTFSYTGGKKTGTIEISKSKFKKLYQDGGFQHFVGAPESPTGPNPITEATPHTPDAPTTPVGVPEGVYHTSTGGTYEVFPDGSSTLTTKTSGMITLSPVQTLQAVKNGSVFDKYGSTVVIPGVPLEGGYVRVFGSKTLTLDGLKKMRNDVVDATATSTVLKDVYGVKTDSVLDAMVDTPNSGGIKKFALSKIDNMISAIESNQSQTSVLDDLMNAFPDATGKSEPSKTDFFPDPFSGLATSPVSQPQDLFSMSKAHKIVKIKSINANHSVVGKHAEEFSDDTATKWLSAWYKGDMKAVYDIDSMYDPGESINNNHPGAPGNTATHKIVWAPAVGGEVPAGQYVSVPGGHPHPNDYSSDSEVDNYLVAANAKNTEYMLPSVKNLWAKSHANGDKLTTDYLSLVAQKAAKDPNTPPVTAKPVVSTKETGTSKSYDNVLKNGTDPSYWSDEQTQDYLTDNGLYNPGTVLEQNQIIKDFFEGKKTLNVDGIVVKGVQKDSLIYKSTNNSIVIVKNPDGSFTKFGSISSGEYGMPVTEQVSINTLNAKIAGGVFLPYTGDQTVIPAPSVPSGPVVITAKGGNTITVDAADELFAFKSAKDEISGLYVKKPDGKITYYGSGNAWEGKPAGQAKMNDYMEKGQVNQIPNPGTQATPTPSEPVDKPKVYSIVGNAGLTLGNNQQTTNVTDQDGNMYVFKPYKESGQYRATHEHAANQIAGVFGFGTASSQLVEIDGLKGQLQSRHDTSHDFVGMNSTDVSKLSQDQLNSLAQEHLLDWSLENPDSRYLNMLVLKDDSVVGIDKGMFGKHWGQWEGLQPNSSAHLYEPLVYTQLYNGIRDGKYTKEQVDSMYQSVMKKARAMEKVSDDNLRSILESNIDEYNVSGGSVKDFADKFIERKNQLRQDMDILWGRVYAMTPYPKPDVKNDIVNGQGHTIHSGFTSDHISEGQATKSYGSTAHFAGTDIEDMHALTWREKVDGTDGHNIRGELKVRGDAKMKEIEDWLLSRAVNVGPTNPFDIPGTPPVHPKDVTWHDTILKAAGNVAYHSDDGAYNQGKLDAMENTKNDLYALMSANDEKLYDVNDGSSDLVPTQVHEIKAQQEMAKQYLGYIKNIEAHKEAGTKASKAEVVRYKYTPPSTVDIKKEIEEAKPAVKVEKMQATRAKNVSPGMTNSYISVGSDGEMVVSPNETLSSGQGNDGYMYLVTLPTGETIEYRGKQTNTALTPQGLTRYTIPAGSNAETSMARVHNQLKEMGLDLKPAEESDYELYYWRHLANVMRERKDSLPDGSYTKSKYKKFWETVDSSKENKGSDEELAMWRNAFSTLTTKKQIEEWLAAGNHLPQFNHYDIRQPKKATGRPWWKRFDVTDEDIEKSDFPIMQSSVDRYTHSLAKTGASMSTEGRLRHFGSWFGSGVANSSSSDQQKGSSSFVFTRQGLSNKYLDSTAVVLAKHVTAKSHNYSYTQDHYGSIHQKSNEAPFDYNTQITHHNSGSTNELMVKDGVSVLDDVELLFFDSEDDRDDAIKFYKDNGITDIRGVPLSMRFIHAGGYGYSDTKKAEAIKALKDWYAQGKHKKG